MFKLMSLYSFWSIPRKALIEDSIIQRSLIVDKKYKQLKDSIKPNMLFLNLNCLQLEHLSLMVLFIRFIA